MTMIVLYKGYPLPKEIRDYIKKLCEESTKAAELELFQLIKGRIE